MTRRQSRKHVSELTRSFKELSLAFEWEIVLINALSKVGTVRHEEPLGNGRDADIYFHYTDNPNHNFLADVTTASDKGLDEINPFDALSEELTRRVVAAGLKPNWFSLRVGGDGFPTYKGGRKPKLRLPGRARFGQVIFNKEFDDFLSAIIENENVTRAYRINNSDAQLIISYHPGNKFGFSTFPSYTEAFRINENTVYSALESKTRKLDGASINEPFGILLCDNDCTLIRQLQASNLSYSLREIVQYFLRRHPEVVFVATFTVDENWERDGRYLVNAKLFRGPDFDQRIRFDLPNLLGALLNHIPPAESTTYNAINLLKSGRPEFGRSHVGGLEVSGGMDRMKIKISSRAVLRLLAGEMSQEDFFDFHRFVNKPQPGKSFHNPFRRGLENGQLIGNISLEACEDEDDDWISIELSRPDPAISDFTVPDGT